MVLSYGEKATGIEGYSINSSGIVSGFGKPIVELRKMYLGCLSRRILWRNVQISVRVLSHPFYSYKLISC